eukprot:symbB.v1.2.004936.t1/scaffold285.1/size239547/10
MISNSENQNQISLANIAFCGLAAAAEITGGLGGAVGKFVNDHVAFHGTADENVTQIMLGGLKASAGGMLGKGVYAAHDYSKAECFGGTVFKVEFNSAKICVTDMKDVCGSWRHKSDAVYSTAAKRSEMCINPDKVGIKCEKASGSLSESARAKIDEILIKNPKLANFTVWLGIAADVYVAAHKGAVLGAYTAGILLEAMADKSERMPPEELEKLIQEGVGAGTLAGFGAGMLAAGVAAGATVTETTAAAGIMGWIVAIFVAGAIVAIGHDNHGTKKSRENQ